VGCGNEISDWDDKAVQESGAGKNSELDPKIAEECKEAHEVRVELQEKTNGFEKSGVVQNRDIVRAITHVPLARVVAKEFGRKYDIHIIFEKDLKNEKGEPRRGEAQIIGDKMIFRIGSVGNTNRMEFQRVLLHELGELYFKYALSPEKADKWIQMRKEAKILTQREEQDDRERKDDFDKGQHHFAEKFADYCMTYLCPKGPEASREEIADFKNNYPEQAKALDELINRH
jgi:hypothetical protein